jgi:hypothetical protein
MRRTKNAAVKWFASLWNRTRKAAQPSAEGRILTLEKAYELQRLSRLLYYILIIYTTIYKISLGQLVCKHCGGLSLRYGGEGGGLYCSIVHNSIGFCHFTRNTCIFCRLLPSPSSRIRLSNAVQSPVDIGSGKKK